MALVVTEPIVEATFDAHRPGTDAATWWRHLRSTTQAPLNVDGVRRLVVVGAHPDDETLGAGGLLATARSRGVPVDLVCVTDGRASHPRSATHTPEALAIRRRAEWDAAADVLGVDEEHRHWFGVTDGEVAANVDEIVTRLVDLVGDGRTTVLVAPWRIDGHPDHAAAGAATAAAARRTGAELWEYPIWFWHWAEVDHARVGDLRPLALNDEARHQKGAAIAAHASQVQPLSPQPGDAALLTADVLAHFRGHHEWFAVTSHSRAPDPALDQLHAEQADPWGVDSRWYERRKRGLLMAMLPQPRFDNILEIGCSTGVLTEDLATRADRVVAIDSSEAALRAARQRLARRANVTLLALDVPAAWPTGNFDLVVVSEVGYFLSPLALEAVVDQVATSLTADGVLVLCHWRHAVDGWLLDAASVHARFESPGLPPLRATYADHDVELRVHADSWPAYDQ